MSIFKYLFFLILIIFFKPFIALSAQPAINSVSLTLDNTGKTDVSGIIQDAVNKLSQRGGGIIYLPEGTLLIRYTIFIPSKIKLIGRSKKTVILANISVAEGRCAFLVGNSYEVNFSVMNQLRKHNTRGWPSNSDFKDIKLKDGLILKQNDPRIITRGSSIQNLLIKFDYKDCKSNWGGYGIQFSNAADCTAKNIWTMNACQAIGIGSDTPPSNPACVNIVCSDIHVINPDPIHTYYAIGFISNSNHCSITNSDSFTGCTENSPDGSLLGVNLVKSCCIDNIKGNVGRSSTGEGILLNNAYGCTVKHINIRNAKKGLCTFYTDANELINYKYTPNLIQDINIKDCFTGICIFSKYSIFSDIKLLNCNVNIVYNINAAGNSLIGFKKYMNHTNTKEEIIFLKNNTIKL